MSEELLPLLQEFRERCAQEADYEQHGERYVLGYPARPVLADVMRDLSRWAQEAILHATEAP